MGGGCFIEKLPVGSEFSESNSLQICLTSASLVFLALRMWFFASVTKLVNVDLQRTCWLRSCGSDTELHVPWDRRGRL